MYVPAMSFYRTRQSWTMPSGQNLPTGTAAGQSSAGTTASETAADPADPVSAFRDLVKGTPEQRMFRAFLARHKLTEAQYAALSTEDRKKLQDEFEEETKKAAETKTTGAKLDVVA